MRRGITFLALVSILSFYLPATVAAKGVVQQYNPIGGDFSVVYLENGDYIETAIYSYDHAAKARNSSITANKTVEYKNAGGDILWSFTITGTFNYTGSSAKCTSVSKSSKINDGAWSITSSTASKSGNKATGTVTAKEKFLGITIDTIKRTLTLTCSSTGSIS